VPSSGLAGEPAPRPRKLAAQASDETCGRSKQWRFAQRRGLWRAGARVGALKRFAPNQLLGGHGPPEQGQGHLRAQRHYGHQAVRETKITLRGSATKPNEGSKPSSRTRLVKMYEHLRTAGPPSGAGHPTRRPGVSCTRS